MPEGSRPLDPQLIPERSRPLDLQLIPEDGLRGLGCWETDLIEAGHIVPHLRRLPEISAEFEKSQISFVDRVYIHLSIHRPAMTALSTVQDFHESPRRVFGWSDDVCEGR